MGLSLVTFTAIVPVLPLLLGLTMAGDVQVRTITVEDQIIMRIPVRPQPPQVEWVEHKGPKCIPANLLAGAILSGPSSIDFVLRNRQRVRAKMDSDCPALDFYKNFYLQPDDDYICAKRETIRSRVGGSCRIEKFRTLVPQYKQVRR